MFLGLGWVNVNVWAWVQFKLIVCLLGCQTDDIILFVFLMTIRYLKKLFQKGLASNSSRL